MKITVNRKKLIEKLKTVSSVIQTRNVLPILNNVFVDAADGKIVLRGTSIVQHVAVSLDGTSEGNVKTTIPAKKLISVLDAIDGDNIDIIVDDENKHATVVSGKSKIKLLCINPEDYPELPEFTPEYEISIDMADLKSLIGNTVYAVSRGDSRKIFKGVFVESSGNEVHACATDGKRLALSSIRYIVPNEQNFGKIVTESALAFAKNIPSEKISMAFSDKLVRFTADGITFFSKLIEGQFPNYRQVIPKSCTFSASAGTKTFLEKIQLLSMISGDNTAVQLEISNGKIAFHAENSETGVADAEMEIDFQCDDETKKFIVSFNPFFLQQSIKASADNIFRIGWNDEASPFLFNFGGNNSAVIMPVRKK